MNKEKLLIDLKEASIMLDSELKKETEYSSELDEIFIQLHEADERIAETRQNTTRLRVETRSMLDDLRKQLG
jgi:hypothetical protein